MPEISKLLEDLSARLAAARISCQVRKDGKFPLLILPTTRFTLAVVEALARHHPVRLVGLAILLGHSPDRVTPLGLWRELRDQARLPFIVASFPDQIIGNGPSFRTLSVNSNERAFSTIESMLAMRFAPPLLIARPRHAWFGRSDLRLRSEPNPFSSLDNRDAAHFDHAMATLLGPIVAYCDATPKHWYAERLYSLKRPREFDRTLIMSLNEIVTLLRLSSDDKNRPAPFHQAMQAIDAAKRELAARLNQRHS